LGEDMQRLARPCVIAFVTLIAATAARAQPAEPVTDDEPRAASEEVLIVDGSRSMANDWLTPPRGWQLGSALSYETARAGIGDHGLSFTDVVFLRLTGRAVVGGRAEVYGGVDLLPKQPSFTDERVYQGAHGGVLISVPHQLAIDLHLDEGELLGRAGQYGTARAGVVTRGLIDRVVAFQGEASAAWTPMRFDDGSRAWFAELTTTGSIVFRAPDGIAAAWLGFGFAFPLAHHGDLPGIGALDPRVRSDFRVGGVLSFIKHWDIYGEYAVLDRGDYASPATMVPILDGGFDQQQLTFGIVRHFGLDAEPPSSMNLAASR
jgi:hypothetical protein